MFYFEISGAGGTCEIKFFETAFKVVGCLVLFTEEIFSMFYEGLTGWIFTCLSVCQSVYLYIILSRLALC